MNITSVSSSVSFSKEAKEDMELIAQRLFEGTINTSAERAINKDLISHFELNQISAYQWEITNIKGCEIDNELYNTFFNGYVKNSLNTILKDDTRQYVTALGSVSSRFRSGKVGNMMNSISRKFFFEIKDMSIPRKTSQFLIDSVLDKVNKDLIPRKLFCKIIISKSGNYYVFREVENIK